MRTVHIIFITLTLFFISHLLLAVAALPDTVAVHFNAAGQADGWMPTTHYLWSMPLWGFGMPAGVLALFYGIRFFPDTAISLPNKAWWLSPEQRPYTMSHLMHYGWWLATIELFLMAYIHYSILLSNQRAVPQMDVSEVTPVMGGFTLAVFIWLFRLIRSFKTPGKPPDPAPLQPNV